MPTDDELAEFIADCNRRRHGRRGWQAAVQAAARRAIRRNESDPQAHAWADPPNPNPQGQP
jgi:hypothetical protein